MAKTLKPTGLAIARNGWKYTFSWKIADKDYGNGQTFQWRYGGGKWQTVTVGIGTTSKAVTLDSALFYPTTEKKLGYVTFRVKGQRKPVTKDGKTTTYTWSEWSEATKTLELPKNPVLSATLQASNQTTFSWTTDTDTQDNRPFTHVEWQTRLAKASDITDGSKLGWKSTVLGWATGTTAANGSLTRTEDTEALAKDSYTRWIRVRAKGPRGTGPWRYAKHVYATPFKPNVKTAKATIQNQSSIVSMTWAANSSASHPIDRSEAQYLIDTPTAGMVAPPGASWQLGNASLDTSGADSATFSIDDRVGLDECLWVRTCVFHDSNENRSAAYRVSTGKLTAPSDLNVTVNSQTFRADVSAVNNSAVPDSQLAILYKDSTHDAFVVGVIAHGSTDPVTVQCPNWASADNISFGVYAFQGEATFTAVDSVRYYTIKANATSSNVWSGGSVPVAPSTVTAAQTDTEGEVLVTWNWSWRVASQAEISWSTNPNAWESTVQPNTFVVDNLYAAYWRVSNLALGNVWYFRVRLGRLSNGEVTYGPYSETVSADLSSAPMAPIAQVSAPVIPVNKSVTVSWNYVSTDGTQQRYAEVWEATVDGQTVTYTTRLTKTSTATSAKVTPSKQGWTTGGTHYIAVRVTSSSGRLSPWSDLIAVTVADPISIAITDISLETITITDEDNDSRDILALTAMPLAATITGAGAGGTTSLVIERADDYIMERPDESLFTGYAGETAYVFSQTGEDEITVEQEDLFGVLDDGAAYRLSSRQ